MKDEPTITQEQAHELAVALLPEVREYIKEHRAEFEEWQKQKQEHEKACVLREIARNALADSRCENPNWLPENWEAILSNISDENLYTLFRLWIVKDDIKSLIDLYGLTGTVGAKYFVEKTLDGQFGLVRYYFQDVQSDHGIFEIVSQIKTNLADELWLAGHPASETDIPIGQLGLSVRAYNCLRRYGIDTAEQMCEMTDDQLLHIRNVGKKNFEEIKGIIVELKGKELNP